MAGLLDQILGGGVATLFKAVMDEIRLSPEQKQAAQQALLDHQDKLAQMDADLEAKLADIQGQNIRAETASSDKYVSRARPTFLYAMIAAIFFSLVVVPLIQMAGGILAALGGHATFSAAMSQVRVLDIPGDYLSLFGVGFLGYTGARSWEKSKGLEKR
jgi:Holin of 3TMs, for gene-transfer release